MITRQNPRADPRADLHQSLGAEAFHSFADDRSADTEFFAQLIFVLDFGSLSQIATDNPGTNLPGYLFRQPTKNALAHVTEATLLE